MDAPQLFRSAKEWHGWFTIQAQWTQSTRLWLYRQARLAQAHRILEVGCGTGVIASEVARLSGARVLGLDIDPAMLDLSRTELLCLQGDAHALPFSTGSFDIVLCHYLLLWLETPTVAVREMARVVRQGGTVLACAEPDYEGRIDHPPELVDLGRLQAEALRRQGADPAIGRRLGELFTAAGLDTTIGVMAGSWQVPHVPDQAFAAEWAMRRHDLANLLSPEEMNRLETIDREALQSGRRVLFVPTFYALGRKSE
jgi:SAM-dependent methyltransferase